MNASRILPAGQAADSPPPAEQMGRGIGAVDAREEARDRALSARAGEAFADKKAVAICLHQLTDTELQREAQVMAQDIARRQSALHQIRMEMRRRKRDQR